MSGPGSAAPSRLLDATGNRGNEAAGNQAQFNLFLQQFQRYVDLIAGGVVIFNGLYTTHNWGAGDLDIATEFPTLRAGTFILSTPGIVTLPPTYGPWIIADGTGFCNPAAQIEVTSTAVTVQGAASYFMASAWQAQTFVKDGGSANYIVL